MLRKGPDMHLIDDEILGRILQRLVPLPVIVLVHKLSPMRKGVLRIRLSAPYGTAGYRFGIRIQQDPVLIVSQAPGRVIHAVKAVAVFGRLDIDPEDHHGVDIADAEFLRKRDLHKRLSVSVMIQKKRAAGRFFGKDAEIDAAVNNRRAERENPADAILQFSYLIRGESVDRYHMYTSLESGVLTCKEIVSEAAWRFNLAPLLLISAVVLFSAV
jgi:hypothetical protein